MLLKLSAMQSGEMTFFTVHSSFHCQSSCDSQMMERLETIPESKDCPSDVSRWSLSVVLKRWYRLLWIASLVGLLFGVVMVWVFFHANVTSSRMCCSQRLSQHEPIGHEEYILTRLRSEEATREVRMALIHDYGRSSMPLWWIRKSVEIKPVWDRWLTYDILYLHISSRHPSSEAADDICKAYERLAIKYNNERYQSKMDEWIVERAALIQSIQDTGGEAATLQAQLAQVKNSQDPLQEWLFLMNGGSSISFGTLISSYSPTTSKIFPSWWTKMPLWWKYLIECSVWGLLAGPVAMYLCEALSPRKLSK